jgi:scytalone dehydratase
VKHKLTADQFLELSKNKNRLGGLVDCIHHVGASKFERTGPDTVTGHHQVFVKYKRYRSMVKKEDEVEATGEGLTMMLHYYQKVDGNWKLAGVKPQVRMSQFNFPEIFKELPKGNTEKSKL